MFFSATFSTLIGIVADVGFGWVASVSGSFLFRSKTDLDVPTPAKQQPEVKILGIRGGRKALAVKRRRQVGKTSGEMQHLHRQLFYLTHQLWSNRRS